MRGFIIGFAVGAWLLQWQTALPATADRPWWFVAAATGLGIALWSVTCNGPASRRIRSASSTRRWLHAALRSIALLAAACCLGFLYAAEAAQRRLADQLPPEWEGVDVRITGIVGGLPAINQSDRSVRFAFDVERVETPDAVVPSRLSLSWYTTWRGAKPTADAEAPPLPEVHPGERWTLTVRLRRPHGNSNPHGFDLEAWMLENDLRASGYVRKDDANRRLDRFTGRPLDAIDRTREEIRARIHGVLGERPYAGVIVALTIGDQRAIPQDQWSLYNRTGVSHLLSISGLHVTLFATLAGGVVYFAWRRSPWLTSRLPARKAAALLGAIAAFGYVLLAGFEVPAQRTLYMLIVAAIGLWAGRPGSSTAVLLWALVVVLLVDPWAVLAPGFWLSFGAVALLIYASVGRLHGARVHWLRAAAGAQWAITVGMVPLMLALFQQVSLVAPVANAFAIPIVSMVVVPLALAWLVLPLDAILVVAHALFAWVAVALQWLAALPAAVWSQHAPPPWTVVAGVVGVLLLLAPRGLGVRVLGVLWLAPLFAVVPPRPQAGGAWIDVLDVGQGLAVVVRTRDHALLYDTGPRFTDQADAGNRIVVPYLRARGIGRLDGVIVTHRDSDHSGGAESVLATVPVEWVASSLEAAHPLVARIGERDGIHVPCFAGQRWEWDGVSFAVLHPRGESYADTRVKSNDRGCVLRIESRHGAVLLGADIEARSESALVAERRAALQADVLVVPHHGSKTSSTPPFLDAVDPALAIVTVGYRNRLGHPRPEIVARYRARNIELLRSDHDGAVEVRLEEGGPRVRRWRSEDRRYWRDRPQREELVNGD
jgi:competence protein ComEC